jgi:hypothetical protein
MSERNGDNSRSVSNFEIQEIGMAAESIWKLGGLSVKRSSTGSGSPRVRWHSEIENVAAKRLSDPDAKAAGETAPGEKQPKPQETPKPAENRPAT